MCSLSLLVSIGALLSRGTADDPTSFASTGSFVRSRFLRPIPKRSTRTISAFAITNSEFRGPRITVRGESSRKAPADEARLQIVVRSPTQNTVSEAMAYVQERMVKIGAFLDELGLKAGGERQTGAYDLRPIRSQRPRDAPEDWESRILGYTLEQQTIIQTSRLDLIGDLLAKTAQHGATIVNLDGFFLSSKARATLRAELLAEAVQNARGEALAVASAAGSKLGAIQTIDIESARFDIMERPLNYRMQAQKTMADFEMAPNIEVGELEVHAAVNVVWLLENGV